jgi:hypothetical protein
VHSSVLALLSCWKFLLSVVTTTPSSSSPKLDSTGSGHLSCRRCLTTLRAGRDKEKNSIQQDNLNNIIAVSEIRKTGTGIRDLNHNPVGVSVRVSAIPQYVIIKLKEAMDSCVEPPRRR